ncbi:hypothetical protein M493_12415 [Geobacillus genomosp. 3]|uniref:Uncharacterized protein n=1 Tax=Geobacillus genomosp. 3 TaxID=1921421 RepID=S5ZEK9_GEOG3|nr:hypothetical protein M493_12415 [Geobacillus genomosp. 3]
MGLLVKRDKKRPPGSEAKQKTEQSRPPYD